MYAAVLAHHAPVAMGTLHQAFLIAQWITISSAIILLNKYLLVDLRFHFPLTLVIMHMVFSGGCAYVWSWCGWIEVPKLTCEDIVWRIVPVAICFAASCIFRLTLACFLF